MDHQLTEKLGAWLNASPTERDFETGNTLLLQFSGNRIRFNYLQKFPRMDVIEYELQKYYNFRVKALTHEQVADMQQLVREMKELHPTKAEVAEFRAGKRTDHDELPEEIQALYVENLGIVQRMREVHLRLRNLSLASAPCPDSERYPFLKELIELDKKKHENWKAYDQWGRENAKDTVE